MNELAIVAVTPSGLELGRRIAQAVGHGEVLPAEGEVRSKLTEVFLAGRPLVCIMALGIVVRTLGPLAKNKVTDAPVVVVDEAGQFAISVLGGHVGGANELAKKVAKAINAVPVITTASDSLGLPPLDLIGREWGWKIEQRDNLKRVAAAMVRGETIAVYQDAGRRDWWQPFGEWPSTFQRVTDLGLQGYWAGGLLITDIGWPSPLYPTVVYRPPTLVLGIGCRRGVPCSEIEAMFQNVCRTRGFSAFSLGVVATASLKANEPGLVEFAAKHSVPIRSFGKEELAAVEDLPTPSEVVREKIGISGVAEPAAMLAAETTRLLMPKYRGERITMALARRDDA